MPELVVENLCKRFGEAAVLREVSFTVKDGEFFTLLGPSGCGKSTTLNCVAGLERPDEGRIRLEDRVFVDTAAKVFLPPEARNLGMVFQSYALWPHMTVAGNIGYGLRMRGWKSDAIAARVAEMLKLLQLEGFTQRPVTQLSGGQRQRVALGRALAVDPHLLLLDEPMSNLDYKVRLELRHELRALQRRIGITAVYVTHDREEALTLADRIAVIDAGRIIQIGAPEEIFHRPESAFVAGFMGADNALDLIRTAGGSLAAAVAGTPAAERLRAHFRSDAATLASEASGHAEDALVLAGVVAQSVYVGHGYRYRVRTDGAEVWVQAPERVAEGTAATVVVPRKALLLFPSSIP